MGRGRPPGGVQTPQLRNKQAEAVALSLKHPIGTPCRFWPGAKEGPGREDTICSAFYVFSSGDIVVHVKGYAGCIAATHVEPLTPPTEGA